MTMKLNTGIIGPDVIGSGQFHMDTFSVTPLMLESVISRLRARGAGYADLYFEKSSYTNFVLKDSSLSACGHHVDFGVGMRALDGGRTGYSSCESTRLGDMLRAADAAGAIAGGAMTGEMMASGAMTGEMMASGAMASQGTATGAIATGSSGNPGVYSNSSPWSEADISAVASVLSRLESLTLAKDSRITKFTARLSFCESLIMQYNSLGELCFDFRPMGTIVSSISFTGRKGGGNNAEGTGDSVSDRRNCSRSFHCGAEMLTEDLLEEIAGELCGRIDPMLEAGRPKGGRMKVVLGRGASGILLHEAMGHAFEADFIRKRQSIFSDKMGLRVCRKGINIVDDGTWARNRGACNFDDEGVPGQKTYMVSDGVLTSFLHDRLSAGFFGVAPTGNGRRESFRFNPIPRMRLTYMENGSGSLGDMIASVKKGIYVDEFSNGQVKIGEGDFTFYVKLGYLIENGRLTMPVKDINLMGNGPQVLADILEVGNDLKIDDSCWVCGKEQSVPVGCGMPSVLVDKLIVGGDE